jgi:hypothetical protein
MPKFIKIHVPTGERWLNADHIVQIERKDQEPTKSCIYQQGGQYVEICFADESVEQIMEQINGI